MAGTPLLEMAAWKGALPSHPPPEQRKEKKETQGGMCGRPGSWGGMSNIYPVAGQQSGERELINQLCCQGAPRWLVNCPVPRGSKCLLMSDYLGGSMEVNGGSDQICSVIN